jgi:hypothetical protein
MGAAILALLIVVYESKNRPQWAEPNGKAAQNLSVIKTETKLDFPDIGKSRADSYNSALVIYKKAVFDRAMEQIKVAYVWETLDREFRDATERSLSDALGQVKFEGLYELSVYMDLIGMKRYALYAIDTDELDVMLQGVYESVNRAVLKLMDEEEEEIEDNNNGDKNETAL